MSINSFRITFGLFGLIVVLAASLVFQMDFYELCAVIGMFGALDNMATTIIAKQLIKQMKEENNDQSGNSDKIE